MLHVAIMMTFLGLVTGSSVVISKVEKITGGLAEQGTVIPAEIRPCVACYAFEFMERALENIKTATCNLDSKTEKLLLRTEERALCDCIACSQEAENGS